MRYPQENPRFLTFLILDLDPLKDIIATLYSLIGRPAEVQPEIFRSFILMNHLQIPLDKWTEKLENNLVLRTVVGFTLDNLPKTSSYYDFMNRIIDLDERPTSKKKKVKPRKKLKKGEKLPSKNPGITIKLGSQLINNEAKFQKRLSRCKERFLQKIFADVAVAGSIELGIIPNPVSIYGDGTASKQVPLITVLILLEQKRFDFDSVLNLYRDP